MREYLYNANKIIKKDSLKKVSEYIDLKKANIQTIGGIDIYVIHEGVYLHQYNTLIAGFAKMDNGMHAIFVDQIFDDAPAYVQKFFLYHEIGHYKNNDTDLNMTIRKNRNKRLLGLSRYIKAENIADDYAAKKIGYAWSYESLSWVLVNVKLPFLSKIELIRRKIRMAKRCTYIEW